MQSGTVTTVSQTTPHRHEGIDPNVLATVTHGKTVQEWLELDPGPRQRTTRKIAGAFVGMMWRTEAYGVENVPATGAVLMAPNHTHYFDAWVQALPHPRVIRYMGKHTLITSKALGRYLSRRGVFPVVRGASDSAAINLAEYILRDGQFLVIFPEGTRCRTHGGGMGTPRRGAARLSLATGAPVLPVATWGMQPGTGHEGVPAWRRWLPRSRRLITVYGKPFSVPQEAAPSVERVNEVRDLIWQHIGEAYGEARAIALGERETGR